MKGPFLLLLSLAAFPFARAEENYRSFPVGNGRQVQMSLFAVKNHPEQAFVRAPMFTWEEGKAEKTEYLTLATDEEKVCEKLGFRSLVEGSIATLDRSLVTGAKSGSPILAGFLCSKRAHDAFPPDERMTSAGAIFKQVRNSGLGEAWASPDGRIWGDVIGKARNHEQAENLCRERGARLPNEDDFIALTAFMSDESRNFIPQILPHFGRNGGENYWSSAVNASVNERATQHLECDEKLFCNLSQSPHPSLTAVAVRCVKGVQTEAELQRATRRDARKTLQFAATVSENIEN